MSITLTFEIVLQANYHVGAGQRAGAMVDASLLRDHDGSPVLRGSMVAGLLLEGLRELCHLTPDILQHPEWRDSAEINLFGSAAYPKRWAYSSARPTTAKSDKSRWGAADVTRVRVNPRTRRVSSQKLFTQEEGDDRLTFQFTAVCQGANQRDQADALLLVAAARSVRYIGAARRRGRGNCRFNLVAVEGVPNVTDQKTALTVFKQQWLETKPLPKPQKRAVNVLQPATGQQKRLRIVAKSAEPILVSQHSEVGNTFETRLTIPGTTVLGALATRAARKLGLRYTNQTPAEFTELFVRGGVQVTGLLPAVLDEEADALLPVIPTPRSFVQCENYPAFTPKGHRHLNQFPDQLHERCGALLGDQKSHCDGKLKPMGGMLTLRRDLSTATVKLIEEPHIKVEPQSQRVDETGGLYEYIALEAGQWFVGEISCDAAWWERVQTLTGLATGEKCQLRVGKATRRGYGLLNLVLEEVDDQPASWIGISIEKRLGDLNAQNEMTLLLLTDAIVADEWQRFERRLTSAALTKAVGVDGVSLTVAPMQQIASSQIVDSFNTHRRMPRWRDTVIEAGSVARVKIEGVNATNRSTVVAALKRVETDGIGWRRHEGFGRIAFNHPVFAPQRLNDKSLMSDETWDILHPDNVQLHLLQKLDQQSNAWMNTVIYQNQTLWERVKPNYDALARLLYLYRHKSLESLLAWLTKTDGNYPFGQPDRLWGDKAFPARSKDSRVEGAFVKWLHDLLRDKLKDKSVAERASAIEQIAAKIATQAALARKQSRGEEE